MVRVLVFGAVDPGFSSGQTKDYGVMVRVLASGAVDPGFPSPSVV
jgi:MOSC domain-containing protein YiiM